MSASFKAILPSKFFPKAFTNAFDGAIKGFSRDAQKELEKPTTTWNHSANFRKEFSANRARIRAIVFTEDPIYKFLDRGTSVRYATMTPNFSPKTRPGSLRASQGSGGLAYVDRSRPRRGIEARGFVDLAKTNLEPQFRTGMLSAMKLGAIKSGHRI